MLNREEFNSIEIGDTFFFTITGPGEWPERGLCSGEFTVIEKIKNDWGFACKMENVKNKSLATMLSISTTGIGWYRGGQI